MLSISTVLSPPVGNARLNAGIHTFDSTMRETPLLAVDAHAAVRSIGH